jgi:hypothetical protein
MFSPPLQILAARKVRHSDLAVLNRDLADNQYDNGGHSDHGGFPPKLHNSETLLVSGGSLLVAGSLRSFAVLG